jgi:outer membrane protein TolC
MKTSTWRTPVAVTCLAMSAAAAPDARASAQESPSALLGSVPEGTATAQTLPLSLREAIGRAARRNLAVVQGTEDVRLSRAARDEERALLLPNVDARLSQARQKVNLAAFGFAGLPGFDIPTLIGPFDVFDARGAVSQSVLDLAARRRTRARTLEVSAAEQALDDTRDRAVLVTTRLYLQVAAQEGRLDAAREQTAAASALYALAVDRKQAGLVPGIDVLRAQVQLQDRRERELAAGNAVERMKLALARTIGLPLGQPFAITDALAFAPAPTVTLDEAIGRALQSRSDWKEAQSRVSAAEAERSAASGERFPSLQVGADYGWIGPAAADARATYTLTAGLRVPLFEGGRLQAHAARAEALLAQRRAEAADVEARVQYDVRAAFLDVTSAAARVEAAEAGVGLAREQLRQAQDRFAAGVAGNLEVVFAQDALATARLSHVDSVHDHNVAKASLARSLGLDDAAFIAFVGGH